MKTFEEYLTEATPIAAAAVRQLPGATAKNVATQQARQNARIAQKKITTPAVTKPQKAGPAKERPALPAGRTGGALAKTKKPVTPASNKYLTKPDDHNVKQDTVTSTSAPRPSTTKNSMSDKARELARKRAQSKSDIEKAKKTPGFVGGLKKSLGGDAFTRGKDAESIKKRRAARAEVGKKVGDFMKKAPGRAVGSILKQKTNMTTGTSASQNLAGPKRGVYNG